MITATSIWGAAALIYGVFWAWYVGLKGKLSATEVEQYLLRFDALGLAPDRLENLRYFMANDDGREWFMVNLLELKSPKRESAKLLQSYSKIFLGGLLKRAGHPFFVANAQARNIENLHCEHADNWTSTGIIRYRSRRDLTDLACSADFEDIHRFKREAIVETISFPNKMLMTGFAGPRVFVATVLILAAALTNIAILTLS